MLLLLQDDAFRLLDVVQALRPWPLADADDAADDLGEPCSSSSTPVIGIRVLSGKTGMPAGLKMLTSRNRIDICA